MISRDYQSRADSMRGFAERTEQEIDREKQRRAEFMKSARVARDRGDTRNMNAWLGYALRKHKAILGKLRSLESIKRSAEKLQSAADLESQRQHQIAAE